MGRIITRLFDRFFNSPKCFDEIGFKKRKNLIYQIIFLTVLCYLSFFVVSIKDAINPLTFITTELEDTIECPLIKVRTRNTIINNFSVNDLNVTQDFNTLNYTNEHYCIQQSSQNYNCYNQAKNEYINTTLYGQDKEFQISPYNITFQNNYLNFNFQSYVSTTTDGFSPPLGFVLFVGNYVYSFTGPIKIQILLKKEKFIDQFGVETIKFVPNIITSLMSSLMCDDYQNSGGYIYNCSSNTITLIYETDIVTTYRAETPSELGSRIIKDTFSICRILVSFTTLALSFYGRKFLFKSKTAWYENSIRDAVLFHFNYHELEPEPFKTPVIISKKQKSGSFIKKLFNRNNNNPSLTNMEQELLKDDQNDEIFESIPLGEIGEPTINKPGIDQDDETETMGSKSKFKRLLQTMSIKDKYSEGLSKISIIQYITIGVILLGIAIFIAQRDYSNRLVTTNFTDQEEIELPNFSFSFESVKNSTYYSWFSYDEKIPNGASKYCKFDVTTHKISNGCKEDINSTAVANFPGFSYMGSEIALKEDQIYSLSVLSAYAYTVADVSKDSMYIKFELNGLTYYIRPFSEITIELTKSIFHKNDGSSDTVTYEPSILAIPLDQISITMFNITLYSASTILNIKYSNNIVRDIYMETTQQLFFRIIGDFFAYTWPVQTFVGILFINIIIKIVYKHSTAHSDFNIRTAVIYHMKHFEIYSNIYKKNNHLKNKK